jgi:hypothetical protein
MNESTKRLFDLLLEYAHLGHKEWTKAHRELWPDQAAIETFSQEQDRLHAPRRRQIAVEIDSLVAANTPWPWMGDDWGWFRVKANRGQGERPQSERPRTSYCVRWNGSWWEICRGVRERREAGYVPLMMCWSAPLPRAGDYLSSGSRARFAYAIAEVEEFEPPRTTQRYTCRLWCRRILAEDLPNADALPAGATLHAFAWHKQKKTRVDRRHSRRTPAAA